MSLRVGRDPLALTIALGRAARRHILIKGGEALELLGRGGTIFLDKTGTIMPGRSAVVSWSWRWQAALDGTRPTPSPWPGGLEPASPSPLAERGRG